VAGSSGAWRRAAGATDHERGGRGRVPRRSGWLTIGEGRLVRSCVRAHGEFTGAYAAEAIKPSVIVFAIEPSNENISQDTGACGSARRSSPEITVHLLPRVWARV
jgi:hypothetical protein